MIATAKSQQTTAKSQQGGLFTEQVPNSSWSLKNLTLLITLLISRRAKDKWRLGKALIIVKHRKKREKKWCEFLREVGISVSSAFRYMKIAEDLTIEEVTGKSLTETYCLAGCDPDSAKKVKEEEERSDHKGEVIHKGEVKAVSVETFTVRVKVIEINERQMTLSVFRQLPLRNIIDVDKMALNGAPWGFVNYWWKGASEGKVEPEVFYEHKADDTMLPERVHVVWQDGSILYRSATWDIANIMDNIRSGYRSSELSKGLQKNILCDNEGGDDFWEIFQQEIEKYNQLVKVLRNLDQLFIAV